MGMLIEDILRYSIGISIAIILLIVLYYKYAFCYWKKRGLIFVKPTIPWGSLQSHYKPVISMGDEFAQLYKEARDKGLKHIGLYTMSSPIYMPVDVDLIKCVLTKDFKHFIDRGIYFNEKDEPIGAHLFAIGGKKWQNLRSKFTPTLTSGKMKIMFQTIADCGLTLENFLNHTVNMEDSIDIKQIMCNFTMDIIGSCAFGLECNSFKEPNPFRDMANRILNRSVMDDIKFAIAINFPKFAKAMRLTWIPAAITNFFTTVVVDTVKYRKDNKVNRNDFLQCLIDIMNEDKDQKLNKGGTIVTMDEIVAQCFVFFVAGYETSATTMAWTLYELAKNPQYQIKVREEFNCVLEKYNGKLTYEAVNELKYMGQCIDETLRKYPPIPFITRECVKNFNVPESNVLIEKGMKVLISTKGIHFDPKYYKKPEEFDPQRFSDENKRHRNQYTYIPFGEGPRICIGMRFGILQAKVGILTILKNYTLSVSNKTQSPLKFKTSFIPQAEGGLWLDFKKTQQD